MWYVVQVLTGTEESIRRKCQIKITKEILRSCFIPYYEEKRRLQGKWIIQKKILFPGYVFVDTDQIEDLFEELKSVDGLTRILGAGQDVIPLSEKEEAFIRKFGGEDHVVAMSEGIIEKSKVVVTSGPLVGMEGFIRKIDRHKRKAWVALTMFGRVQVVQIGLEIVSKTV